MANVALQSFMAAQNAGQALNVELDNRRADVQMKQQQIAQGKQSMAIQQEQQAQAKASQEQMAKLMEDNDRHLESEQVENGTAPDDQKLQTMEKTADMYEKMGKAMLGSNPNLAESLIRLGDSTRGRRNELEKSNLQISKKKAKDTATYAGTVLDGTQTYDQAFDWVMKHDGLQAAMAIPKDPAEQKLFWKAKQTQGLTASEQVAAIAREKEQVQRAEEKKEALEQRKEEERGRRADKAAMLEVLKESKANAREYRTERRADAAADKDFKHTEKINTSLQSEAKPLLSDKRNLEKVEGLLQVNSGAGDQQVHQALTSLFGEFKGRATSKFYADNKNFGSAASRLSGFLSHSFAGRYQESDRKMIRDMVADMKNNVLEPGLASLESSSKKRAAGYGLDPDNVQIEGDFNRNAKPKAPPAPQYNEGQVAVNPQTGAKLVFKQGKWVTP